VWFGWLSEKHKAGTEMPGKQVFFYWKRLEGNQHELLKKLGPVHFKYSTRSVPENKRARKRV
jgi:hypothetical protein